MKLLQPLFLKVCLLVSSILSDSVEGFGISCPASRRIASLPSTHPTALFQSAELENEEPMSVIFQRALVYQRMGSLDDALNQYELFLKAAEQCEVDPSQYAEVHVNCGAIHLRQGDKAKAQHHLEEALKGERKIGKAYVNLGVLQLQQAQCPTISRPAGLKCLRQAQEYCQQAVDLDDDEQSVQMAQKLIRDIQMMLLQAGG